MIMGCTEPCSYFLCVQNESLLLLQLLAFRWRQFGDSLGNSESFVYKCFFAFFEFNLLLTLSYQFPRITTAAYSSPMSSNAYVFPRQNQIFHPFFVRMYIGYHTISCKYIMTLYKNRLTCMQFIENQYLISYSIGKCLYKTGIIDNFKSTKIGQT